MYLVFSESGNLVEAFRDYSLAADYVDANREHELHVSYNGDRIYG